MNWRIPSSPGSSAGSSDLDVHPGRVLGVSFLKRRFYGGRLGVVDRLNILIDRIRRRLGVLIDNELVWGK